MVKKFAYCLTINNPTDEDWLPFKDIDGEEMVNTFRRERASFNHPGAVEYETVLPVDKPDNQE